MKKLTKILVVVLSLVLALGCFAIFAGCNNKEDKEYKAEQMAPWGDAFKLIAKMNDKGWFGSNYAGKNHEQAVADFRTGNALFMIEGSWSRGNAKGTKTDAEVEAGATQVDVSSERMLLPMPNVSANWIYEGSPAGKGDAVVGGVTAGWMISRKAWKDETKKQAAVAFVTTMTSKGLLDACWAGTESFNPANTITQEQLDGATLASYSMMKMASSAKTITAMDARLAPEAMTSLRALTSSIVVDTKEGVVKKSINEVYTSNEDFYTPFLKYTADTKGVKKVADIASDITAKLDVTTQFHEKDWQAGCYNVALGKDKDGNAFTELWGYDNSEECLVAKYPNISVNRTDVKIDNAAKDKYNTLWAEPNNMPDVLGWFSDAQAAVIRDDDHLVPVAEIQKEFGDYGSHLNAQFFDKYALPIVGTYEALYVNVKMLANYDSAIKTAYDAFQAAKDDNTKKVALYDAVKAKLSTWAGLEAACDAAVKDGKIAFAQDRSSENNYIVDQAIMIMGGTSSFEFVPGAPATK